MPETGSRTQIGELAHEPIEAVREQRIDPPHRLGDGPPIEARVERSAELPSLASGYEGDGAELASVIVVQQLRLQAQQLAAHLREQQAHLDRREAAVQAQAAEIEQQARNNRLWLKERHAELGERETALRHRDAELTDRASSLAKLEQDRTNDAKREREELAAQREALGRREAAVRDAEQSVRARAAEVELAAAAVENAAQAHDQLSRELDERTAQFDDRQSWCLDAVSGFVERGKLPAPWGAKPRVAARDAFDELAELLSRLAQRRKNLDETEAMLVRAARNVSELRQAASVQSRIEPSSIRHVAGEPGSDAEDLLSEVRRLLNEAGR